MSALRFVTKQRLSYFDITVIGGVMHTWGWSWWSMLMLLLGSIASVILEDLAQ